jgi:hypothetical protein
MCSSFFRTKKKIFHPHYTCIKKNIDETIISRLKMLQDKHDLWYGLLSSIVEEIKPLDWSESYSQ